MEISSDASSSSSNNSAQFRRIYQKQLAKMQPGQRRALKIEGRRRSASPDPPARRRKSRSRSRSRSRDKPKKSKRSKTPDGPDVLRQPQEIRWYIYPRSPVINMEGRIHSHSKEILGLPIYRKQEEILKAIIQNQFVLVTGETGCGKSTQVPRLIYEYLRETGVQGKIMCVQPRRLAVINLHSIMESQMQEKGAIGYQIGMTSKIHPNNRIVFVTNGIFLQRLVHSTDFFAEYPFIILDEVHQRDIDTDFILLTLKRLIRQHPRVRIILMSATIDNQLFRYYFASDHIDNILNEENFYKKIILAQQKAKRKHCADDEEDDQVEINSDNQDTLYKTYGFEFMRSKNPCPAINVTDPGKYKRRFFYLDTMHKFLREGTVNNRWGSVVFSDKYPSVNKELHQTVFLILDQVAYLHRQKKLKPSVLIFVPGLAEIEGLSESISSYMLGDRIRREFEVIHVHSTILTKEITNKLHQGQGNRIKVIISTNIAESSITVMGVMYVIDFCLSKEVRFDMRSRMQNLELVWASQASCNQRAGRTGRVCDGFIFRLLEESFYKKLAEYSTPEIQRSSLDKLILRIKLLHEGHSKQQENEMELEYQNQIEISEERSYNSIFADPGEVLGSAIQPPNLKNIDTAIKSLQFCGGLEMHGEQFFLTELGRFYIDIPIDITYCKLLVISLLMGTFEDMIILVSILSQSKNAIRKGNIDKNYTTFFQTMDNPHSCDFLALINLYKSSKASKNHHNARYRNGHGTELTLETYFEVTDMIYDIKKRMKKRDAFKNLLQNASENQNRQRNVQEQQQYLFHFKLTLLCGFIENVLKVREPTYDQKQEKRLRLMRREGIKARNTVCLLGSSVIRKPENDEALDKLKNVWRSHVERAVKIKNTDFTITHGLSYLHFDNERDLNKFLFYRFIEGSKKSYQELDYSYDRNYLSPAQVFKCFGEMDHMQQGRPVTFCKEQLVAIDNYSLNRVINVNEGDQQKFLIANNIAKQSSRMVARYTSLLPQDIAYLEVIGHLLFYPFIHLIPNRTRTRYEYIQLKKKHRIPLPYFLTLQEIEKANQIRRTLRAHLSLTSPQLDLALFQQQLHDFVFLKRQEVIEEERWQDTYLQEVFEKHPELKAQYSQLIQQQSIPSQMVEQYQRRASQKVFMNDIKASELTVNFFSDVPIGNTTIQWRRDDYNRWKRQKLRQIMQIQRKALDHDTYLACGSDSCGLRLAKLKKVGPITQEIYRDLYQIEEENIIPLEFSEMGSHFCTLLMSNYIDAEYRTFACTNHHYFGILLQRQRRIKILPFSQLIIIYPDGVAERASFQHLDTRQWKRKHDYHVNQKFKMKLATYCFVCNELIDSFKDLEYHIRESRHSRNVREFKRTLPQEDPKKPIINQSMEIEKDNQEGY